MEAKRIACIDLEKLKERVYTVFEQHKAEVENLSITCTHCNSRDHEYGDCVVNDFLLPNEQDANAENFEDNLEMEMDLSSFEARSSRTME